MFSLVRSFGFISMGPISGILSDKHDPGRIATGGMKLVTLYFLGPAVLNFDFQYRQLGIFLFLMGCGSGMFGSPNSSSNMNSVPPRAEACPRA